MIHGWWMYDIIYFNIDTMYSIPTPSFNDICVCTCFFLVFTYCCVCNSFMCWYKSGYLTLFDSQWCQQITKWLHNYSFITFIFFEWTIKYDKYTFTVSMCFSMPLCCLYAHCFDFRCSPLRQGGQWGKRASKGDNGLLLTYLNRHVTIKLGSARNI